MKTTKMILLGALVAGTAVMSANAGVHVAFSIPVPAVVISTPVVTAEVMPAPLVESAIACPGVDYVWAPGYWVHGHAGYNWVRGCWNYRPTHWFGHFYHGGYRR